MDLSISLKDIADNLGDEDSKHTTIHKVLDEVYGMVLGATKLTALATGGFEVPDLINDFKPSDFISNDYINVTKEEHAIYRYDKLAQNNLSIILLSLSQALKENEEELKSVINQFREEHNIIDVELENSELQAIQRHMNDNDLQILNTQCNIPQQHSSDNVIKYIDTLLRNFKPFIKNDELIEHIKQTTLKYYNINLLEISTEFPEVKLWIDLKFQKEILQSNQSIKQKLIEIQNYQADKFEEKFGLEELENIIEKNSNNQLKSIQEILEEPIVDIINEHHTFIVDIVNQALLKENDIPELKLPQRKDIYIPQSYKYFYYQKHIHKRDYLDDENWNNNSYESEEDIGKKLFQALRDPYNINQPIILLGHPGAGKSMLSSQFAYKLIANNEFIPFFIKLRHVDSKISDVNEHINQGIKNSLLGNKQIDWIELVKKFPSRIPVIILDGFDELLRASQTQINDYILKIKDIQNRAQSLSLNLRIILTTRLTIMQDVHIPDNCLIMKLNSFDSKRKNLWIQKWNEEQTTNCNFRLPDRDDINELSKEPLLLFLLALYDFEDNALSKIAEKNLNKASLYDKLFESFTIRQLRKDHTYNGSKEEQKREKEELFRLRIGFFATMLFLRDELYHFEKDFDEELDIFKLNSKTIKAKNILVPNHT